MYNEGGVEEMEENLAINVTYLYVQKKNVKIQAILFKFANR